MLKTYSTDYIINKFSQWYAFAAKKYQAKQIDNYNAFVLSTAVNNTPDSRVVLLKDFSTEGFVFYTNAHSVKGQQLAQNSKVAMLFYWPIIQRQVRILGEATPVLNTTSDAYFASRPYLHKIGAWASKQSEVMPSTLEFYKDVTKYGLQFPKQVPRPNHWHGFKITPHSMEFWKEGSSRLHLRESFTKNHNNKWHKHILYP